MQKILDDYREQKQTVISQELIGDEKNRPRAAYYSLVNHSQDAAAFEQLLQRAEKLQEESQQQILLHLRASDIGRKTVAADFAQLKQHGLASFLVVGGDRQAGSDTFSSSLDLLRAVQAVGLSADFLLASTLDVNLSSKKNVEMVVDQALAKEAAGAKILITQVFLSANDFLRVRQALKEVGSNLILVAGVMANPSQQQLNWVEKQLGLAVSDQWRENPGQASQDLVATLQAQQVAGIHYFAAPKVVRQR
ncbi:methylenetetrahydrofolate reductase [Fructobacillus pseudoficulneus]|uniref:Methylenetetrahydrofolate reductase n=1 Tax=Fructobacillus pseudoficulneus TaxID=220714 RepID=A0A3F3GWI1_9LACO|nr:methylenetetrahydrofolate reductase [Fructobacillus pseudoficulneus]GAP03124.1 methylenetetrahydrofolate reductase [Fructobacillus pseudoficulneus]SEH41246.1 Methylenetetrahydrofolate reductase [Fructobacillus pseudoficulneus]